LTASSELLSGLPYARRYARALTGDQARGDAIIARAIPELTQDLPPRLALYAAITRLTQNGAADCGSPLGRHLLLLTSLEELDLADAARVVGLDEVTATEELTRAREAVKAAVVTDVLIIEDEPVIAMDIRMLVEECGHRVIGIAATQAEALALAREHRAGLILADINLGRGGNGIKAVQDIMATMPCPVIFVTAYPEQLLTAEGIEPAFVMRKPFDRAMLAILTYQAFSAGRVPLP